MKPVSVWAANTQTEVQESEPVTSVQSERIVLTVHLTSDSLWLFHTWKDGSRIGFRTAFSPSGNLEIKDQKNENGKFSFLLEC